MSNFSASRTLVTLLLKFQSFLWMSIPSVHFGTMLSIKVLKIEIIPSSYFLQENLPTSTTFLAMIQPCKTSRPCCYSNYSFLISSRERWKGTLCIIILGLERTRFEVQDLVSYFWGFGRFKVRFLRMKCSGSSVLDSEPFWNLVWFFFFG